MRPCYTVNTMEQRPFCDRQLGPRNGTWSEHNFRGCLGRISSMSPRQFFSDVFAKPSFLFLVRLVSASFFLEPISWKPQKKPTPDRVGIKTNFMGSSFTTWATRTTRTTWQGPCLNVMQYHHPWEITLNFISMKSISSPLTPVTRLVGVAPLARVESSLSQLQHVLSIGHNCHTRLK